MLRTHPEVPWESLLSTVRDLNFRYTWCSSFHILATGLHVPLNSYHFRLQKCCESNIPYICSWPISESKCLLKTLYTHYSLLWTGAHMHSAEFYDNASFHENTVLLLYHPFGQVLHCTTQHHSTANTPLDPQLKCWQKDRIFYYSLLKHWKKPQNITCSLKNHILPFFFYFLQLLFFFPF